MKIVPFSANQVPEFFQLNGKLQASSSVQFVEIEFIRLFTCKEREKIKMV